MKTPELESKYIVMANELAAIKNGRRGHNLWFWIIRTWLRISLEIRLERLKEDYKDSVITKVQYDAWSSIIKNAL